MSIVDLVYVHAETTAARIQLVGYTRKGGITFV